MTNLSLEKINALLKKDKSSKANQPDQSKKFLVLSTYENRVALLDAITHRRKKCTIFNPITKQHNQFNIRYDAKDRDLVFVGPANLFRFVPCGWFSKDSLTKAIQEEEVGANDASSN